MLGNLDTSRIQNIFIEYEDESHLNKEKLNQKINSKMNQLINSSNDTLKYEYIEIVKGGLEN